MEIREYGTINAELEGLRDWLLKEGITQVGMESTGSYWKPTFNVLEGRLAHLLRHAMIRPGFVPSRGLRELRDFTSRRGKMTGNAVSERNRVERFCRTRT